MATQVQNVINQLLAREETGIVYQGPDRDVWSQIELPRGVRDQWNLYTNPSLSKIMLARKDEIQMEPSVCMGDNVEDKDGWAYSSMCKYAD